MALLAQELVDLVVEVPDPKLTEAGVLNLRNFLRDLSDDLKQEDRFIFLSTGSGLSIPSKMAARVPE